MANDTKVTGKKYRILTNAVTRAWDVISFWTSSHDVEMDDGTNVETTITNVKSSIQTNSQAVSALSSQVNTINTNMPFKFGVDGNGNYGYYKAGADSVTPFKQDLSKKILLGNGTSGTVSKETIQNICKNNNIPYQHITSQNFILEVTGLKLNSGKSQSYDNGRVSSSSPTRYYSDGAFSYNNGAFIISTGQMLWVNVHAYGSVCVPGSTNWHADWERTYEEGLADCNYAYSFDFSVTPITNIYLIY